MAILQVETSHPHDITDPLLNSPIDVMVWSWPVLKMVFREKYEKKMSFFFFAYLYTGLVIVTNVLKTVTKNMLNKYCKLQKSNELARKMQLIYTIALWELKEEQ